MRVAEDSRVVTLARAPKEEAADEEGPDGEQDGPAEEAAPEEGGSWSVKLSPGTRAAARVPGTFRAQSGGFPQNSAETPESSVQARVFSI